MPVMQRRAAPLFDSIRTEGGLLPSELLTRLAKFDATLDGLTPESYGHLPGERLREAVSRSWARLRGAWEAFSTALAPVAADDPATGLTRDRWLSVLFHELGWGRLRPAATVEIAGRSFPLSHEYSEGKTAVPLHLVGANVPLDCRSAGVRGAATASPHAMVQELLNLSDERLWAVVSNGRVLRLLRDNRSLTRQAFVEFDLERMFAGEAWGDFAVLWLLLHISRVVPATGEEAGGRPETCWLERWSQLAAAEGTRALDALRQGVEEAIRSLGEGFLGHPKNAALHKALETGALHRDDYYRELLRLVYRLLFTFVAEARDLLLRPDATDEARRRYEGFYAVTRLRRLAARRAGTRHGDLWEALRLVMRALGRDGLPALGLPALGSYLWRDDSIPHLLDAELSNEALLAAVHALAFTRDGNVLRPVDYKNLGAEELGSIYESLLELRADVDRTAHRFTLRTAAGNERKSTGSYYTPSSLIQCLLDTALDPVLDEKTKGKKPADAAEALLALKVVDPACGSGHFLIAAAHRIARRLAAVRTGESEPAPEAMRTALRDVIGHCLYGVDINEMAVELCKVSLWMEALEPGKPLSFLDHRILCGNSLLGTTPRLLAGDIPDDAYTALEGDEKKWVALLKKRNKKEREQSAQVTMGFQTHMAVDLGDYLARFQELEKIDDVPVDSIREKERRWTELSQHGAATRSKLIADAWCSAFVAKKTETAPAVLTTRGLHDLREAPERVDPATIAEVKRLAKEYKFFHWHLAFPHVFPVEDEPENEETGWSKGFDVVLGNPPWERVKLQEKEFFAAHREIAEAPNAAARKKLIAALPSTDEALWASWLAASRRAEGESHIVRDSGRYPLCGKGDVNTYALFAEHNVNCVGRLGRAGFIVPSGIATDDTTKDYFSALVESGRLRSIYDFRNHDALFYDVGHRRFKFCLITASGAAGSESPATFVFFAESAADVRDPSREFTLKAADIALLNPNTRTCPTFRSRRDAEINRVIYSRVPVLVRDPPIAGGWNIRFAAMLHMANDSGLFRTRTELEPGREYFRLVEAKMVHHFDHRHGDYADKPSESEDTQLPDVPIERLLDPTYTPSPRYWVARQEVDARLDGKWSRDWLLGWRDICRASDVRTVISAVIPRAGAGDTFLLAFPSGGRQDALLLGALCSFVLDYCARQKVGGTHLKYHTFKQLPLPTPAAFSVAAPWRQTESVESWILPRVLELTYTAWDLEPFAKDCGYDGPPFRWDPSRRALLRAELDAAFFHLYGIVRDDVDYIMETFPIVKRHDVKAHGVYRTKQLILECYDAMAQAIATGATYQTMLDPPPADPRIAHPPRGAVPSRNDANAGKVLLLRRPPVVAPCEPDKYRDCVPLVALAAAAGGFSEPQSVTNSGWVRLRASRTLGPGMFVARVDGKSMQPRIPDGAWCLFGPPPAGTPWDHIVLVQLQDLQDPETGAQYTVKEFVRVEEKVGRGKKATTRTIARLRPLNPDYKPIDIPVSDDPARDVRVIAEVLDVLTDDDFASE